MEGRMGDSWKSGRSWFDYGIRKSSDVDAVHWAALRNRNAGADWLNDETLAEMELIVHLKMEQVRAYKEECAARFSK